MMHKLIVWWFGLISQYGYGGIVAAMAAESSIIPLPSEVVIPPAAFWASKGQLSLIGVIVAGTVGSYIGATVMYWTSRWLGRPLLLKYGKYVMIPPAKLEQAERFLQRFENGGVFFARLLPVVRHLIGIPAGIIRAPFLNYSISTILGSATWCTVLALFGQSVLGAEPDLLNDPDKMIHVLKAKLLWIVVAVLVMTVAYVAMVFATRKK